MEYKRTFYEKYIKRLIDFFLALIAIIVLSPILLIVSLLVRLKLGSPVLYKQQRPGLNEKIFTICKFRTMTNETDENGELLPDEVRLTRFGKILRSTSLDELPELINILNGTMAIVGPRPQLVRDMVFMTTEQRKRHAVRPGLTGLAQVNGRNDIDWESKLNYDLKYLEKINIIVDFRIIAATFIKVFRREGIAEDGVVTATDYGEYLLNKKKISVQDYREKQDEAIRILNKTKKDRERWRRKK